MPSFAVHAICGNELLKDLNLSENAKKKFLIGNIIPDVSRIPKFNKNDNIGKRRLVQDKKKITHFRTDSDVVLAYPDLDRFLEKYSGNVRSSITSFAYFFHLYTDYYYFKIFLPKILTFYDKDMNVTNKKSDVYYVKINRTNEVIEYKKLFNKESNSSIYRDYSISNGYLMNKYNFTFDYDELFDFVDQNGFFIEIEETNPLYAYYAILKMKKYLYEDKVDGNLNVFSTDELDNLIDNIVDSFKKKYGYLLPILNNNC